MCAPFRRRHLRVQTHHGHLPRPFDQFVGHSVAKVVCASNSLYAKHPFVRTVLWSHTALISYVSHGLVLKLHRYRTVQTFSVRFVHLTSCCCTQTSPLIWLHTLAIRSSSLIDTCHTSSSINYWLHTVDNGTCLNLSWRSMIRKNIVFCTYFLLYIPIEIYIVQTPRFPLDQKLEKFL